VYLSSSTVNAVLVPKLHPSQIQASPLRLPWQLSYREHSREFTTCIDIYICKFTLMKEDQARVSYTVRRKHSPAPDYI